MGGVGRRLWRTCEREKEKRKCREREAWEEKATADEVFDEMPMRENGEERERFWRSCVAAAASSSE